MVKDKDKENDPGRRNGGGRGRGGEVVNNKDFGLCLTLPVQA